MMHRLGNPNPDSHGNSTYESLDSGSHVCNNFYSFCDGRVLITQCSGLAIISIYPIKTFEFHQYTWKGTIWDGEALAGNIT